MRLGTRRNSHKPFAILDIGSSKICCMIGEIDKLARCDPAPFAEFRFRCLDIDIGVGAGVAQCHPALLLAAIPPVPQPVCKRLRNVIVEPFVMLLQQFGLPRADFLAHLPKAGLHHRFAMINPALRHLPGFGAVVDPAAGKQHVVGIQQEDADTGAIGTIGVGNVVHEAGFRAPNTDTPRIRSSARASW